MKFTEFRDKHIDEIEKHIELVIEENKLNAPKQLEPLIGKLKNFCLRPGKRIRPLLFLLGVEGFSDNEDFDYQQLYTISAVIEIMHSFLLIHDDIMDQSDLRRGLPSFHVELQRMFENENNNPKIGEDLALVFGDILFFIGVRALGKYNLSSSFWTKFSECYINTVYGQILDVLYSLNKNKREDEKISLEISRLKTSYYTFFYPFYLGTVMVKDEVDSELLKEALVPAGIAFQIRDDIISTFDEKSGKSNYSDIIEGKLTALIDFGEYDKKFFEIYSKKDKTKEDIDYILSRIIESNAIEKAKNKMNELFDISEKNINKLEMNKNVKDVLIDLINRLRSD